MPYLKNMLRCWEEDGCLSTAGSRLKTTRQKAKLLGFTFFMAWCYHTLFLSAFGIAREPLWCAAWVWACLEGPLAVAGIASALLLGRFPRRRGRSCGRGGRLVRNRRFGARGVGHLFGRPPGGHVTHQGNRCQRSSGWHINPTFGTSFTPCATAKGHVGLGRDSFGRQSLGYPGIHGEHEKRN